MVYSTCTFAPEENEGTILAFLKSHDDFYLEERECPKGLMAAVPQWAFFGADKEDDSERDLAGENGIESIIWNVRSALCPIRQREKAILWQCSAAKKTVWAFQEKEACLLIWI